MNKFMQHALSLAQSRRGFCAPNPAVGCVVVKNNQVIATGVHMACGEPHAEVDALKKVLGEADGAQLYVTLEPCCHWGRTPPCTQAILQAKIGKVYYGFDDPNPKVAGQGAATLREAGIDCELLPTPAINAFYQSYVHWQQTKKPFVTIKLALSQDGFIANADGSPVELSGKAAKQFTFQQRLQSDAILTTITTVQNDDPQLNIRLPDATIRKSIYLLDSHLKFRFKSKLMRSNKQLTLFHQKRIAKMKTDILQNNALKTVAVRNNDYGLNLHDVLKKIGEDGVHDLWVEAGATCLNSFIQQQLVNRLYLYYSPKVLKKGLPGLPQVLKINAKQLTSQRLADDTLLSFDF